MGGRGIHLHKSPINMSKCLVDFINYGHQSSCVRWANFNHTHTKKGKSSLKSCGTSDSAAECVVSWKKKPQKSVILGLLNSSRQRTTGELNDCVTYGSLSLVLIKMWHSGRRVGCGLIFYYFTSMCLSNLIEDDIQMTCLEQIIIFFLSSNCE